MTVFIVPHIVPKLRGLLENFCLKIKPDVFVTCGNAKVVCAISEFLVDNKISFSIVTDCKHGIIPKLTNL